MNNNNTLYVGLDVHKESITVAYAINSEPVELMGKLAHHLLIFRIFVNVSGQSHRRSVSFMKRGPVVMDFIVGW
ncbi:transposase [Shigella boydii]|uniref:Transposase n=1 Tax=Shigella dysenteriae TaxID=622 RepID=A0A3P6M1B2_SHIDY|nr:transposase [Shigella boydii]VDG91442.1 transposase [Shigella dysenteriae]